MNTSFALSGTITPSAYEALVKAGALSAADLTSVTRAARERGLDIEAVLMDELRLSTMTIGKALGAHYQVQYQPYDPLRPRPSELLKNLKREFVEADGWLPLEQTRDYLAVLCLDPERVRNTRSAAKVFPKAALAYRVTTRREFSRMVQLFYDAETPASNESTDGPLNIENTGRADWNEDAPGADNEVVRLVNKMIIDACQQGASDIHVEPYPGNTPTEIRFRRDGTLMPYTQVPAQHRNALASRIKIMCDLDISEKRKPQDGKIRFRKFGPLDVELRVATLPTAGGMEDIVLRILGSGEPIALDALQLTASTMTRLKTAITRPHGLFFVCGPTGSGKTTTLHSILGHLNTPDTKIWTAEDPVEITQKGLRQVQVNRKVMDFATVMRAFLRADPDIIMVGEMRDAETAHTGIEASLTGHLVFATLHTNSAPEAITRLLDMGMDALNFSDALVGILAQRLVKKLCDCKQSYTPEAEELRLFMQEYATEVSQLSSWRTDTQTEARKLYADWIQRYATEGRLVFAKPQGCDVCAGTGYKGRVGIHELLVASDAIKKHIQSRALMSAVAHTAMEEGMHTLKMDGMEKVLQGLTDLKQVRAACIR